MYKAILVILLLIFSHQTLALDELSSIPESHQKVLGWVIKDFGLKKASTSVRNEIYKTFKYALEQDGWYASWVGNDDLTSSKFKNDKVRVFDLIIPSNDRVNNITLIYFKDANQIFYTQKESIEGSSSLALEEFKKEKEKEENKVLNETNNYAFIQRKGYLDFDIFHLKSPNGLAAYFSYGTIDLN